MSWYRGWVALASGRIARARQLLAEDVRTLQREIPGGSGDILAQHLSA